VDELSKAGQVSNAESGPGPKWAGYAIVHFFRNSICFMCFLFGLEILRLVYKKEFFEILNGFYLI
jgi:hypothetical protein